MKWLERAAGVAAALAAAMLLWAIVALSLGIQDNTETLRHRCDDHGGIYRAARDGGRIIAVTCNDGRGFSR